MCIRDRLRRHRQPALHQPEDGHVLRRRETGPPGTGGGRQGPVAGSIPHANGGGRTDSEVPVSRCHLPSRRRLAPRRLPTAGTRTPLVREGVRMIDSGGETLAAGGDSFDRQLFTEMIAGVAVHEIILDDAGTPIDYRFLQVNPEFEKLTGVHAGDILGKRVLEVIPDLEPDWIERYGRVALTGVPDQFESYSAALGRHLLVRAFRPAPGQFAALFIDVTERTRAEAGLRERNAFTETIISSAAEGLI